MHKSYKSDFIKNYDLKKWPKMGVGGGPKMTKNGGFKKVGTPPNSRMVPPYTGATKAGSFSEAKWIKCTLVL